jgi:hypothetical protein
MMFKTLLFSNVPYICHFVCHFCGKLKSARSKLFILSIWTGLQRLFSWFWKKSLSSVLNIHFILWAFLTDLLEWPTYQLIIFLSGKTNTMTEVEGVFNGRVFHKISREVRNIPVKKKIFYCSDSDKT